MDSLAVECIFILGRVLINIPVSDYQLIFTTMASCLVSLASTTDYISVNSLAQAMLSSGLVNNFSEQQIYSMVCGTFTSYIDPSRLTGPEVANIYRTGTHIVASYMNGGIDVP